MRDRNLQLDSLRCVAILGVLITHTNQFLLPEWWARWFVRPGWAGVDLFFVLSGFLISGLLFSEFQERGKISFARFAIRRALKLYPTFYVLVFGVMFVRLVHAGFHNNLRPILTPVIHDLLFIQSYLPGTYGHFWSLAVEEHFYILLPLVLYTMLRKSRPLDKDPFRRLPLVFVALAVGCLVTRFIHGVLVQPYSYFTHLFPTHLRIDSLLFGVLLSYWYRFHPIKFNAVTDRILRVYPILFPISLMLILPAFIWAQSSFQMYTIGLTSLYLGFGGILISLLQVPFPAEGFAGALLRPIVYIGRHSYPIYLFHIGILEEMEKRRLLNGWLSVSVYLVIAILAGIVFSKLIEFPVLRLRDRLFPPQTSSASILLVAESRPSGVRLPNDSMCASGSQSTA